MYYSKYFEGHVDATTTSTLYYNQKDKAGPSSIQLTTSWVKTKSFIMGEAIANTLRDCGMDAVYDLEAGYLYLDYTNSDIGFYCFWTTAGLNIYMPLCKSVSSPNIIYPTTSLTGGFCYSSYISWGFNKSTSSSTQADDYKFCITVRGDTNSLFDIGIGTYTDPTYFIYGFATIGFATDKRNDKKLLCMYCHESSYFNDVLNILDTDTLTPTLSIINSSGEYSWDDQTKFASPITLYSNYVVLIEQYSMKGSFIAFDNIYINPGLTAHKFYEINSHVYFMYSYACIQCVTQVNPTPAPEDLMDLYPE